ncbi:MAG: endonuclease/exonuclease/phosphatase family protein [Paludibacter sp.]|nr:endonuclease/exonuclease/phosphatase family protein [Paludibacter sp.]
MESNSKVINLLYLQILLIFATGGLYANPSVKTTGSADETTDTLRIATFNIRIQTSGDTGNRSWTKRKQYVGDIISNVYKFDLFGVQEIANSTQQSELLSYLSGYNTLWKGRGNTAGNSGERCAIVYRTSRFDLINSGWFFLSTTPDVYSVGWDAAFSRICLWIKLKDKVTNRELYFFNTHFDHEGATARTESAKLVIKRIGEITEGEDIAVFLTGDLNFSIENGTVPYTTILSGGLRDSRNVPGRRQVKGPVGTSNGWDMSPSSYTESRRIDFIFVNQRVDVLSYTTIDKKYVDDAYPSDHFPVMITALTNVEASGIPEIKKNSGVTVMVDDQNIRFDSKYPYTFEIFNSIGTIIYVQNKPLYGQSTFSMNNTGNGLYFVRTKTEQGRTTLKLIIK